MLNNTDYIRLSLELHLFFARIMKEHSLFLEAGFTERDPSYKKRANDFQKAFTKVLDRVVTLADHNISNEVLLSQEIVTDNTLSSEDKTNYLLGTTIDTNLTKREMGLKSGVPREDSQMVSVVNEINQQVLPLIRSLIEFKTEIYNKVVACEMFTANYPLLIMHIINEAKMYYNLLFKLLSRNRITEKEIYEQEIFWNNIMKEHAEFIRGLLDPTEIKLIATANDFVNEYNKILRDYRNDNAGLSMASLQETVQFKNFKEAGENGILKCDIKSIIIPLLADHVLREANHFIRVLKQYSVNS